MSTTEYFRVLVLHGDQLLDLATMDSRGFRGCGQGPRSDQAPPHGTRRGGRGSRGLATKGVTALLEADPESDACRAALRLGSPLGSSRCAGMRRRRVDRRACLRSSEVSVRALGHPGDLLEADGSSGPTRRSTTRGCLRGNRHPIGPQGRGWSAFDRITAWTRRKRHAIGRQVGRWVRRPEATSRAPSTGLQIQSVWDWRTRRRPLRSHVRLEGGSNEPSAISMTHLLRDIVGAIEAS